MDQQRKSARRRAVMWSSISYIPLVAGVAWFFFAMGHWSGSRAAFLAVSGAMVGVSATSALFLPVLRLLSPTRRLLGMSLTQYTYVSISAAIAIAAVLLVVAFVIPK